MDHDELLRRLDQHLAHGNRIMARSNDVMARSNDVMARNELAFRDLSAFLAEQTVALRDMTREFVAEMRAQREVLFRVLDRFDGKGRQDGQAGA